MGSISYERFLFDSKQLVQQISGHGKDKICFVNDGEAGGAGYIKLERLLLLPPLPVSMGFPEFPAEQDIELLTELEECKDDNLDEDTNSVIVVNSKQDETVTAEYQVHYSAAYSVPILLARFYAASGQLISLDTVYQLLGTASGVFSLNEISISPHPLEDTPWIQVHPCKTGSIMAQLMDKNESGNYLVGFLSYYGQGLGLHLDPQVGKKNHVTC
jgi:hypothetical protein